MYFVKITECIIFLVSIQPILRRRDTKTIEGGGDPIRNWSPTKRNTSIPPKVVVVPLYIKTSIGHSLYNKKTLKENLLNKKWTGPF